MPLPSDPITAVADAIATVADLAKPLLDSNEAQAHENDFLQQCQQISDIFALPDSADRVRALGAFASRVCIDNGYPTGGLGDDLSVPVGYLEALLTIAAARIRDTQKLNDLLHALQTK